MQIEVSEAQNGQSITAHVGDTIVLRLPENAATGYRWALGDLDNTRIAVEDQEYSAEGSAVGGGGTALWKLHAKSAGNFRIEAKKWRPWEGDRSITDRFSLAVDIRP